MWTFKPICSFEMAKGLEEAIVGDKIECDNCGWSWDVLKDGGDDLYTFK
jgi:hypothetical protein